MRFIKCRRAKFVAAVVGVIVMTIATSRLLYMFLLSGHSAGLSGAAAGRYHLWLALGALLMTCVAGGLTFFFFLGSEDKLMEPRTARGVLPA